LTDITLCHVNVHASRSTKYFPYSIPGYLECLICMVDHKLDMFSLLEFNTDTGIRTVVEN